MRPTTSFLTALAVAALAAPVQAGLPTGRVEYDPATHRHAYTHTLDDTAGPWPITEASILVAPGRA